jgi:hypothetical protein
VLPVEDQEAHALYMESALRSQESVSMAVELLAEMYTGSSARVPAAAQRVSALERDLRTTTYKCASPEKKLAMMRTFRAAAYTFLEAIAESAIEMEEEAAA